MHFWEMWFSINVIFNECVLLMNVLFDECDFSMNAFFDEWFRWMCPLRAFFSLCKIFRLLFSFRFIFKTQKRRKKEKERKTQFGQASQANNKQSPSKLFMNILFPSSSWQKSSIGIFETLSRLERCGGLFNKILLAFYPFYKQIKFYNWLTQCTYILSFISLNE